MQRVLLLACAGAEQLHPCAFGEKSSEKEKSYSRLWVLKGFSTEATRATAMQNRFGMINSKGC